MVDFAKLLKKGKLKAKTRQRPLAIVNAPKVALRTGAWRGEASLWNFWEDGVSQSFLKVFLACREHARLKFVEGWTSRLTSFAIEFGSCVHWVLEQGYGDKKPPDLARVKVLVKLYEKLWLRLNPNPWTSQQRQQEKVYGYVEAVLPVYFKRWGGDFPGFKNARLLQKIVQPAEWMGRELEFKVPFKFADGKQTWIRGKRDGVFLNTKRRRWTLETKTKGRIDEEGIQDTLPSDLQCLLYTWADIQEGNEPVGVLYNIIRTPGQRQTKKEDLAGLIVRVAEAVANPKDYDHYFIRYEMPILRSEIKDWEARTLRPLMDDVRAWVEGKAPHYNNPEALITKYGRSDMFEIITKGTFETVFQRPAAFTELSEFVV